MADDDDNKYGAAHWVKVIIMGAILGAAGYYLLVPMFATRDRVGGLNEAIALYGEGELEASVRTYDSVMQLHPKLESSARDTYKEACVKAGVEAYEAALSRRLGPGYESCVFYLERARAQGATLETKAFEYLCDAYVNLSQFDKARALLEEARSAGKFEGRLPLIEKKISKFGG